ncbi:MAG: hypothetical protein K6A63_08335, partial [Acholeplasmatales bacterium]|nr:hypothetical protein [Acholeplasmatales bacterium]
NSDGIIYKDIYNVEIKNDEEFFYCRDIYISYKNPISKARIYEYYIDYYAKNTVISYSIESEYFNNSSIIGKFKYTVKFELSGEEELIYNKECYINVIDDIKPILTASITDNIGDGTFIEIADLITAGAIDDIDGDISDRIKIIDVDNYLANYNKSGTYSFRVSVTDNAGNTESKLVSYDVYVEEVQIDDEIEVSDDISIVYEFNVSTTNQLTRALFSQKLVFSGFYESGEELTISSKYFENKEIPGSYLVSVLSNNEVKYFLINVEEGTSNDVVAEEEDKNSYTIYIIIGSVLIALIGGGTAFYFIRKRKRNQE